MNLELVRDYRDQYCTLGVLNAMGRKWQTLERPWVVSPNGGRGGVKGVSCIPPGEYKVNRHSSESFQNVWVLTNPELEVYHWESSVPRSLRGRARTSVLIHPGNFVSELRGCIAIGKERRKYNSEWCLFRSRDAINELRMIIGGTLTISITIREVIS